MHYFANFYQHFNLRLEIINKIKRRSLKKYYTTYIKSNGIKYSYLFVQIKEYLFRKLKLLSTNNLSNSFNL